MFILRTLLPKHADKGSVVLKRIPILFMTGYNDKALSMDSKENNGLIVNHDEATDRSPMVSIPQVVP